MRWVTGHNAGLDALACAWLIRRFIDPDADILFSSHEKIKEAIYRGFIPFHVPDCPFSPHGERPTFSLLLENFRLSNPALKRVEALIYQAGKSWETVFNSAAGGLKVLDLGMKYSGDNDAENLCLQECILNALYFRISMKGRT
jgi:hypothetical protein